MLSSIVRSVQMANTGAVKGGLESVKWLIVDETAAALNAALDCGAL